jgi:hypothetical protein
VAGQRRTITSHGGLKSSGGRNSPEYDPIIPKDWEEFGGMLPFHAAGRTVTRSPDWVTDALQTWVIRAVAATRKASVHDTAAVSVGLPSVTFIANPPDHTEITARQVNGAGGGAVAVTGGAPGGRVVNVVSAEGGLVVRPLPTIAAAHTLIVYVVDGVRFVIRWLFVGPAVQACHPSAVSRWMLYRKTGPSGGAQLTIAVSGPISVTTGWPGGHSGTRTGDGDGGGGAGVISGPGPADTGPATSGTARAAAPTAISTT